MSFLFAWPNSECDSILPQPRAVSSVTGIMFRIQFIVHQASIIKVTRQGVGGNKKQREKIPNEPLLPPPTPPSPFLVQNRVSCTPFSWHSCNGFVHRYSDLLLLSRQQSPVILGMKFPEVEWMDVFPWVSPGWQLLSVPVLPCCACSLWVSVCVYFQGSIKKKKETFSGTAQKPLQELLEQCAYAWEESLSVPLFFSFI